MGPCEKRGLVASSDGFAERDGAAGWQRPETAPTEKERPAGRPIASPSDEKRERKPEGERRGRSRRGRGGRRPSNRAARVLSKQTESVDLDKNADEPLTKQEAAVLRDHFRFLRENRKELRLKVNANERPVVERRARAGPSRCVCRHLLGKVERSNVLAAAERLEPARAARLLAGIIGFSSDIEYVLLFLEKVEQSTSPADATDRALPGPPAHRVRHCFERANAARIAADDRAPSTKKNGRRCCSACWRARVFATPSTSR